MNNTSTELRAKANPTKRFFVDMLTRDIELHDAILDLLDNCVDGILRSNKGTLDHDKPYAGFWAKIAFDKKYFSITDNCGGIPLDLAQKYAFMMGRPKEEDDSDIATVGMYGIGMKRAIFKMGKSAEVVSQTNEVGFKVNISSQWLQDDEDWELPITHIDRTPEKTGTKIHIGNLRENVSTILTVSEGNSSFDHTLKEMIGHHYGFIISKGFQIYVNEEEIKQKTINILWSPDDVGEQIAPYLYQADIDGLKIKLAVGFYKSILSQDELDEEQITRRSKDDAGWTIICNDRVVLYNDKTRLTGWGEAGVPTYHSQFIGISGVVQFSSNDAWKLPVTTTKRGIDTSSDIYLYVKNFMREGLKKFTDYTNHWKQDSEEEKRISGSAKSVSLERIFSEKPDITWIKIKNRPNEQKLNIPLPKPRTNNPRRQIRFIKNNTEIEVVTNYLFGDENISITPAAVGEACFDRVYAEAKK